MTSEQTQGAWILLVMSAVALTIYGLVSRRSVSPVVIPAGRDTVVVYGASVGGYDTTRSPYPAYNSRKKRAPLDLNRADSAALVSVYGIGPVFASRIVDYRARLGGFVSADQLMEVRGITKERYDEFKENFILPEINIIKININFATQMHLAVHPYITQSMARRLVKGRQMKGGYTNCKQLIDNDILTPAEAHKIEPYISFETPVSGVREDKL